MNGFVRNQIFDLKKIFKNSSNREVVYSIDKKKILKEFIYLLKSLLLLLEQVFESAPKIRLSIVHENRMIMKICK